MMKTAYSHKISIVLNACVKHIEAYIFPVLINISHKGLLVLLAVSYLLQNKISGYLLPSAVMRPWKEPCSC